MNCCNTKESKHSKIKQRITTNLLLWILIQIKMFSIKNELKKYKDMKLYVSVP